MEKYSEPMPDEEILRRSEAFDPTAFIRSAAIPTKYKLHTFRSRLEARWAVFMDCMEIAWEYEPEGFQMSDGMRYLPDFWLPRFRWFAEIKPTIAARKAESKYEQFVMESGQAVLLLVGPPDFKSYEGVTGGAGLLEVDGEGRFVDFSLDTFWYAEATEEHRLWSQPEYDYKRPHGTQFSARYAHAIESARTERFGC